MSMTLSLTTVRDRSIEKILADGELVLQYLGLDEDEAADDSPGEDDEMIAMDLDKSWHAIHFLLTGSAWEGDGTLSFLLQGGTDVEGIDAGYGPPRLLTSEEVAEVSQALTAVSPEELRRRFDPEALQEADIYPNIWMRDPKEDDTLGYVLEYYDQLRNFIATANRKGMGLIVAMM